MLSKIRSDFSLSAVVAGLIALFATYSGPVLIVAQAANSGKLSQGLLSTWIWALSIGAGSLGLYLSLKLKMPVIGAWSTPSVALLVSGLVQYSFSEVVGCYVVLAIFITLLGFSGLFTRLMKHLPVHLLSAMIAGVLFQFCIKIFQSRQSFPLTILPVIISYSIFRKIAPRYAVAFSLFIGLLFSFSGIQVMSDTIDLKIISPVITWPVFSSNSLLGLGVPLLFLSLTQYATSIHILHSAGFDISPKTVVGISGLISIPLSLFGSSGANPAAIVGAICASPECHPDPDRRYIAGVVSGLGYIFIGVFGATVIALFSLLPSGLTVTLAGLALLGTLVSSLTSSLLNESERESSLITFLVTVSGMSFFGLGSALWGLIFGFLFVLLMSEKFNLVNYIKQKIY